MVHDPEDSMTLPTSRRAPPRARWTALSEWLGARWCGLTTGHYLVRTTTPTRVALRCWYCGYESPGWTLPLDRTP